MSYGVTVNSGFNPKTLVCIDTETTGLSFWRGNRPFAVSLCDQDGNSAYVDFPVDPSTRRVDYSDRRAVRWLRSLLADPEVSKVYFNRKFDERMLSGIQGPTDLRGLTVAGRQDCAYVAARVCNTQEPEYIDGPPDAAGAVKRIKCGYKLKPLAWKYAGYPMEDESALQKAVVSARRVAKKNEWEYDVDNVSADYWLPKCLDPESEVCKAYAVGDVLRTLILWLGVYRPAMEAEDCLKAIYEEVELPLLPAIAQMESRGLSFSRERNQRELRKLQLQLAAELAAIRKIAGPDFEPSNDNQIRRFVYSPQPEGLGLTPVAYTDPSKRFPMGQPRVDWKSLLPYNQEPFVRHLISYRNAEKGISTYHGAFEEAALPDPYNPGGECIFTTINQTDTRTGRTSSGGEGNRNFQNISNPETSVNKDNAIQARVPFGPRPGYVWICGDYASQEFVIFAEVANIETMQTALLNGEDLHAANAERAWGGRGNPYAVRRAAYSLELGNPYCQKAPVRELWRDMGWSVEKAQVYGYGSPESLRRAEQWLSRYDYRIVKAEKAIDSKRSRSMAKSVGYAKIYGGGVNAVMAFLMCGPAEAREALDRFEEIFPGIDAYSRSLISEVYRRGYIITPYGRKLHVEQEKAYKAVNYVVQSSAADMMKRAVIRIGRYLEQIRIDAHPLLIVHDEYDTEIRRSHAYPWVLREIRRIMEDTRQWFKLPIKVDFSIVTERWDRKQEITL